MTNVATLELPEKGKEIGARAIERKRMENWLKARLDGTRRVEIVTLTPALAELLLRNNPNNRPRSSSNVNAIAGDSSDGRFLFNGESIVVTARGSLADGQHRCEAVVLTGVPVETAMVFGIDEAATKTIDIGRSRSVGNILAMEGTADANAVSAVASLILQWKTYGRLATGSKEKPSKLRIIEAFQQFEGISESVEFCKRRRSHLVASRFVLGFCHWAFTERAGRVAADTFIAKLVDGVAPKPGDPIYYCSERLMGIKGWVHAQDRASLIFQAWNAWRKDEEIHRLYASRKSLPKLEG